MAMKPLSEVLLLLRSTTARSFADRHPEQDLVLLEPFEKGRSYTATTPVHGRAVVRFLPRVAGKPVPVGRDSRSYVLLDHPAVSRLHMVLAWTNGAWKAMDRSSNGCYLEEERLPPGQATLIPYGAPVRLGKALVLRLFTLEAFYQYARGHQAGEAVAAGGPAPPPPAPLPPTSPQADTWRMPALTPEELARPAPARAGYGGDELNVDFEFPDKPPPGMPAAPTQRMTRRVPPEPAPAPAPPSQPKRERVAEDDIEFEFDFDFDGKGGFA